MVPKTHRSQPVTIPSMMLLARVRRAATFRSSPGVPQTPRPKRPAVALTIFFVVAALAFPTTTGAAAGAATLTLSRTSGPAGGTVVVKGYHLPPLSRVQIMLDGHARGLPTAWVGRTGFFKASIKIPSGVTGDRIIGAYRVKQKTRKVITASSQLGGRLAYTHFDRTTAGAPPPQPPTTAGTNAYGSIATDTKANIHVGGPDGERVAHKFVASTTSAVTSIRFAQRGGSGYSGGNGGTMRISIQPDDGSGNPSGSRLASLDYSPGNPGGGWSTYLSRSFSSSATLTKGKVYYVVFENIDGSPKSNYISVNELFVYGSTLVPRQPIFSDASYAVLIARPSWRVASGYTADMDLTYANGGHDGMGYIAAEVYNYISTSGSSDMFREHFTVSGASRTVTTAAIRVRRSSGSSPLTIRLENSSGSLIEAVSIPASSIPASSPGGDNGGSVWAVGHFSSSHVLAAGSTYSLTATTGSDTTYTSIPLLDGTPNGFQSYTFSDGQGQATSSGSGGWSNIDPSYPEDIQFYLK